MKDTVYKETPRTALGEIDYTVHEIESFTKKALCQIVIVLLIHTALLATILGILIFGK